MDNINAFDLTVSALRDKGLSSDEILEQLSNLFCQMKDEAIPHGENEPKPLNEKQKKKKLRQLLLQLGMPCNLTGYPYTIEAVMLYEKNSRLRVYKDIYLEIAKKFNTSVTRVERAIRTAIESTWNRCPPKELEELFGNTVAFNKSKPTNSEFIARCAELLKE